MAKVSQEVLAAVQTALQRYELEVEATGLTAQSKATYLLHARNFVRWLDDGFEPKEQVIRKGGRRGLT